MHQAQSNSRPIVVLGATGRSGRRACAALLGQGAAVLAVARDRNALQALVHELGRGAQAVVAAVDDEDRLRGVMAEGAVVLNCVGPFSRYGRTVQNAALAAGRHCLDLSGEPAFVRATLARDAEAKQRGVLLMSGVGFDVVPTDALARVLAEAVGGEVQSARVAYSGLDAGPTEGIALTMLQGLLDGGLAVVDGAWRREALGHHRWSVRFPTPLGLTACVSLPWGDLASLPRSTGARTVRVYLPRVFPPANWAHAGLRALRACLPSAIFCHLAAWLARRMVTRLPLRTGHDALLAVVEVTGRLGTKLGWLRAPEDVAMQAAALCAQLAAAPGFAARGAQTPSVAFGARTLLERLQVLGLHWGIE